MVTMVEVDVALGKVRNNIANLLQISTSASETAQAAYNALLTLIEDESPVENPPVYPNPVPTTGFTHPALKNAQWLFEHVIDPKVALKNSKITLPNASEVQGDKLFDGSIPKKWFEVLADGGMRFNSFPDPSNGTTPNSETPRSEIREFEDIALKTNFPWDAEIIRRNLVIFERLPADTTKQAIFAQIHGESTGATNKNDAKNATIRSLRKPLTTSTKDEVDVLLTNLQLNHPYIFQWYRKGKDYYARIWDGITGSLLGQCAANNMLREDGQYPKWGVYSEDMQVVQYCLDTTFTW